MIPITRQAWSLKTTIFSSPGWRDLSSSLTTGEQALCSLVNWSAEIPLFGLLRTPRTALNFSLTGNPLPSSNGRSVGAATLIDLLHQSMYYSCNFGSTALCSQPPKSTRHGRKPSQRRRSPTLFRWKPRGPWQLEGSKP
ncbi:unnamed protein product [Cuscuta campestris]|uniref:Uncharacterized protein n=1 Tax=Cuscuta campestris TaxID=132261 RepID=A0A484M2I3_9ASTE|nr:unnamed protein product [Cuscuta campestris]